MEVFLTIALVLIWTSLITLIFKLLKQPMIPAYFVAGLTFGKIMNLLTFNSIVPALDFIFLEHLGEIGIAFLLFIVGLELDVKKIKNVGKIAVFGTLINSTVMYLMGFLIIKFIGFSTQIATIGALTLGFSSTMVAIKLISDMDELKTLHGRIIIGMLLMEDILAVIAISFIATEGFTILSFLISILEAVLFISISILLAQTILPKLFKFAAKTKEMLFVASLGFCFLYGLLFNLFGFSYAIGTFLAGIILGNLPYNLEISNYVSSLKDFFLILYFFVISIRVSAITLSYEYLIVILLFSLTIILIKPMLLMFLSKKFNYATKTCYNVSLGMSQTSEFSIILISLAYSLGRLPTEFFAIAVYTFLITSVYSSYVNESKNSLFLKISKFLGSFFSDSSLDKKLSYVPHNNYDVLLIGMDRTGYGIYKKLIASKMKLLVIDYNPEIVSRLISKKVPTIYGDINNEELLSEIDYRNLKFIISTSSEINSNKYLIKYAKRKNKKIIFFTTAYNIDEALDLYKSGADYVIVPQMLGGNSIGYMIEELHSDMDKLINIKIEHIKELYERAELKH